MNSECRAAARAVKKLLLLLLVAVPSVACRSVILEKRSVCPSFLYFDILNASRFDGYEKVYATAFMHPDGRLIDGTTTSVQTIGSGDFYFLCRNTEAVRGYGVLGHRLCYSDHGTEWVVPVGNQFDSLFRFSYVTQVLPESFSVPVEFVKECCKVTVQFIGAEYLSSADGVFPFDLLIRGNTCGIDVMTGTPVRGNFEYRPPEKTIGCFEFILPRQADHDLRMELYGRKGVSEQEGHVQTFDLWEALHETGGISWNEKNLPDIRLEINYVQSRISVEIIPWESRDLQYES